MPLTTLDSFVTEKQIDRVDAIKLDVEGAELHVIRGADQTIRQFKPVMMVEINETTLKAAGTSAEELFNAIVSYGYKAFVIRKGEAIPTSKVMRPTGYQVRSMAGQRLVYHEFDNYLFLPKDA